MEEDAHFEQLCKDVYGYYGNIRDTPPNQLALIMLRSMGEHWTLEEVDYVLTNRNDDNKYLSFLEFRRLAKSKWFRPSGKNDKLIVSGGYEVPLNMPIEDVKELESAFNRISDFYSPKQTPRKTVELDALYSILTGVGDKMPKNIAKQVLSDLHVYENKVSLRALLCLLGSKT
ncbi:conserved hypothetical protein [Theileria equi strain WA]|uniref:Uncharacterized protein n=1 Tax=Theileria equi strain WA TaxID=1537102 RepID=L1LEY3_THEEQ|nr:conserved hypothetical protein [Theileria equi strain WA]EKX73785.1 conserved hypothetical protein [Theileria equi strain WA]|eukprot:XP_004833237.1 conserved hypothetical protein [Theileria equi strain WA]